MRRLCCYSLTIPNDGRTDLFTQLVTSVDSLRTHNSDVAIVLFVHGEPPIELVNALAPFEVRIWQLEPYADRLAKFSKHGWPYLSQYPLLHKFLNFTEICALTPDQVLLLDCDTYFLGDVKHLFERYSRPDIVAREEVGSRRSHYGYDPKMIDENRLDCIGQAAGITPTPPFNLGVVLLNNNLWQRLSGLSSLHIQYAWRFMLWMAANPSEPISEFGEGVGIESLRQQWPSITPEEQFMALPYPSENRWILDEVTLWMTLGHLPNTTYSDFDSRDVIQNGEFDMQEQLPTWIVCHYFSHNMERIANWVQEQAMRKF